MPDPLAAEIDRDPEVDECALELDCPDVEMLGASDQACGRSRRRPGLTQQQSTMPLLDGSGCRGAA